MNSLSRSGPGPTEPLNVRVERADTTIAHMVAEVLRSGSFRYGNFMKDVVHTGVPVQAAIDALAGGPEGIGPWKNRHELALAITPTVTSLIEFQMQNGVTPAIIQALQSLIAQMGGALPQGGPFPLLSSAGSEAAGGEDTRPGEGKELVAPAEAAQDLRRMGAAVHSRKAGDRSLPTALPDTPGESGGK